MRIQINTLAGAFIASLFFSACQKQSQQFSAPQNTNTEQTSSQSSESKEGNSGYVYTASNATTGNRIFVYNRSSAGMLTFKASYASGGNGSGGGLGNQGAVILTDNDDEESDDFLLTVNAGSNSVSSFKVKNGALELKSTVNSNGMRPVSVTQHDDIVFVLNAGGTNNISGFRLMENGMLQAIAGSSRPLSAATTGPAQVSFVNDGKVLVVTEKATNKIVTYTVNENGIPGMMHMITSSSPTPFGFATGKQGNIFVSEAVGGAPGASVLSSYHVYDNGTISAVTGSVGAGQAAACWVVLTNNGKYAYATNTASNNISTFGVNNAGGITVSQAISATTQAGPIDAALSNNSKFLYVLNGGGDSIQAFVVTADGSLNALQTMGAVPMAATGLAAK